MQKFTYLKIKQTQSHIGFHLDMPNINFLSALCLSQAREKNIWS